MTKKWLKILQREKNRDEILKIILLILSGEWEGLDIIKLQGTQNYYRCRIGKIRIIFFEENKKYFVDKIGYRGDVYK